MENIMLLSSLIAGSTERDRLVIGQQMGIHTFRDKQRIFASKKKTDPGNVCPPKSGGSRGVCTTLPNEASLVTVLTQENTRIKEITRILV
ncbi:Hypothetical predicted protein [Mytilus galloprovincialis]|uniref:Uncharacterized protein n=1 Tax=Mytilus galloprovincialis TaxID=29158 RepID=A0A8B6H4T9_MYTGA|nr:Hypothetical predicted protein [Mytilus galloprovincialis]